MNRQFSLAGLLRLRLMEQDHAAGALGAAHASKAELARRRESSTGQLADLPSDACDAASLMALASSRAAARSMLADMDLLARSAEDRLGRAQAAFGVARARSLALEKLEASHRVNVAAEDLKIEQKTLDEIGSTSWHRDKEVVETPCR